MKRWDSIGQAHRSWILIGLLAVFCVAPEAANYTDYPDSFGSEYEYYDYFNAGKIKTTYSSATMVNAIVLFLR